MAPASPPSFALFAAAGPHAKSAAEPSAKSSKILGK
jgi:hypothetical protein